MNLNNPVYATVILSFHHVVSWLKKLLNWLSKKKEKDQKNTPNRVFYGFFFSITLFFLTYFLFFSLAWFKSVFFSFLSKYLLILWNLICSSIMKNFLVIVNSDDQGRNNRTNLLNFCFILMWVKSRSKIPLQKYINLYIPSL